MRAEHQKARELGEQLLSLAHSLHDPASLVEAHRVLGTVLWNRGELPLAHEHLEQGIALYEPHQHRTLAFRYGADPGVVCRFYAAVVLWSRGYPQQARRRMEEALTLAQEISHPHSLAFVLVFAAILHRLCGEVQAAYMRADAATLLAREQGIAQWFAGGTILRGWAVAAQGQAAEGSTQIHQGLAAWRAASAEVLHPFWLALLAEAYAAGDDHAGGLHGLAEALALIEKTGERWYEAEIYHLKGELLLLCSQEHQGEAAACFEQALIIARRQQAKSWELRAAMSLGRLWQRQGQRAAAHKMLVEVYGWFTEGFDTADLQEAKALLEELA
jgi:predicted ATPase